MKNLLIAFDSKTGNVRRFVKKINSNAIQIDEEMILDEKFVLITYTTGMGKVPSKVSKFLEKNHKNMVAVAASGNRNWGESFCKSANTIAEKYNVPVILRFEMAGTPTDVEKFKDTIKILSQG